MQLIIILNFFLGIFFCILVIRSLDLLGLRVLGCEFSSISFVQDCFGLLLAALLREIQASRTHILSGPVHPVIRVV